MGTVSCDQRRCTPVVVTTHEVSAYVITLSPGDVMRSSIIQSESLLPSPSVGCPLEAAVRGASSATQEPPGVCTVTGIRGREQERPVEGRNNLAVKPAPNPPVIRTASETREILVYICFDAAVGSNKPLQQCIYNVLSFYPNFSKALSSAFRLRLTSQVYLRCISGLTQVFKLT